MPSVSEKQARFMAAVAHDPDFAKRAGVSQKVGKDFNEADTGSELLSNAMRHPRAKGGVVEDAVRLAHHAARQRLETARKAEKTEVGIRPRRASGGDMPEIPYFVRQEERQAAEPIHPGGLVNSAGPGRTDIHNVSVPSGSYVLPADVVSGLGEGNTMAGSSVIDKMLHSMPFGITAPHFRGSGRGIPHPPAAFSESHETSKSHFKSGGQTDKPVPIVIAGGEYVVSADAVAKLGGGDLKRGHEILDAFVLHVRKKTTKTLKKLPGPVK